MRCHEVMTAPVRVTREGEPAAGAARLMRDANIGFLPVCDAAGRAVGVLTDRDIAIRACAEEVFTATVGDIMTPEILSCTADDRVELAEALMCQHRTSRILVVDADGRPAGVISVADLARIDGAAAARTLREVSEREVAPREGLRDATGWATHLADLRRRMVEDLMRRGIGDRAVLRALLAVPREVFMPPELVPQAYNDRAVPLGDGRALPSPYAVALMAAALHPGAGDRLLEIDTGCGYATVVYACLAGGVTSVAGEPTLAETIDHRLRGLGVGNVRVVTAIPEGSFDAIAVNAGGGSLPESLLGQLAVGGRLVVAVEDAGGVTRVVRITRTGDSTYRRDIVGEAQPPHHPAP
jgi:protein-L-isoaspartate(D-aspartate) O-methyltransferase